MKFMFTQEEVELRLDEILHGGMPYMQVIEYFENLGQEQVIVLCRGFKSNYLSPLHFWLKARQRREWWDVWDDGGGFGYEYENYAPYAAEKVRAGEPMPYEKVTNDEFYWFINRRARRTIPLRLITDELNLEHLSPEYVRGFEAISAWNSQSAMAEFKQEYVAVHWRTTE